MPGPLSSSTRLNRHMPQILDLEKIANAPLSQKIVIIGVTTLGALALGAAAVVVLNVSIVIAGAVVALITGIALVCLKLGQKKASAAPVPQPVTQQEEKLEEIAQILSTYNNKTKLSEKNLDKMLEAIEELKKEGTYQQLYDLLVKKFGKQKADEAIVGSGLKSKDLSVPLLENMISWTQEQQDFETLLSKIKAEANKDLILDEQAVIQKFENPKKPFTQEQRAKLQFLINQAYVMRELKQKSKYVSGDRDEKKLLTYLKFKTDDTSDYQNKEKVYEILQTVIQQQLVGDVYRGSLDSVKQVFAQCTKKARLKAAGVTTDLQMEKFQALYQLFQTYKAELLHSYDFALPSDFPMGANSLAVQSIKKNFDEDKLDCAYLTLSKFFGIKNIKDRFDNEGISAEELRQSIEKNKHRRDDTHFLQLCDQILKNPKSYVSQQIAFYKKWGSYIQAELIQGFSDEGEALGDGVCWSVCERIQIHGQKNPEISSQEFSREVKITPTDRIEQASYAMRFNLKAINKGPKEKAGFKETQHFDVPYVVEESFLSKWLKNCKGKIAISFGWLRIGIGIAGNKDSGHATLLRFDEDRNRYWILDPNIGFMSFEKGTAVDRQKECLECFKDLIATYYPATFQIIGSALQTNTP